MKTIGSFLRLPVNQWGALRSSIIRRILGALNLVLIICALIGGLVVFQLADVLLFDGLSIKVSRFILIRMGDALLSVIGVCIFFRFSQSIRKQGTIFEVAQSRRLLCISLVFLVRFGLGILNPSIPANTGVDIIDSILSSAPTFDFSMLMFSLMFFALAGIFEYGRALKEETEDIL